MSYSFENSVTMIDDKTGKKITAKRGGDVRKHFKRGSA